MIDLAKFVNKNSFNRFYLFLLIILLVGIFFRFYNLDHKIFWGDETVTSLRVSGYDFEDLKQYVYNQPILSREDFQQFQYPNAEKTVVDTIQGLAKEEPIHQPLYFILTRFWVQLFGNSVAVTRSCAAAISLLVFPGIYWLCQELFGSSLTGWIAISLTAISPLYVLYAQEARPYSIWMVVIILSSAALLRAVRLGNKSSWIIYTLTLILALYSHPFSIFVWITQGFYIIITQQRLLSKTVKSYLFASGAALISLIPWIINILATWKTFSTLSGWTKWQISLRDLFKTWLLNLSRIFVDFNDNFVYKNLFTYLFILGVVILVSYSFYYLITTTPPKTWLFILCLTVLTALPFVVADLFLGGRRSSTLRYSIPSVIGIQIAVSYFLASTLVSTFPKNWYRLIGKVMLITLITLGLVSCSISSQATIWWNKTINVFYPELVQIVNEYNKPTVIISEWIHLMTLSYIVQPQVKLFSVAKAPEIITNPKLIPQSKANLKSLGNQFNEVFITSRKGLDAFLEKNPNYKIKKTYQWKTKTEPAMEVKTAMWRLVKNEVE